MKFRTDMIVIIALLCFFCAGCGADDTVYLEQADTETADTASETEAAEPMDGVCYVYICGAVLEPGVYEVKQGSRIYEVVDMAGGLTEDADVSFLNQAETVYDGQMIYLPTEAENETDGRVNINTASIEELMTLSGIGQAKAEQILAYRNANGDFSSEEEIMNVDGIKEGLYNRIKDDIRVK